MTHSQLIARLERLTGLDEKLCVPHISQDGARIHTPSWGCYQSCNKYGSIFTVEWCSEPFCERNRAAVKSLIHHGHSADSCPLPRLREWLKAHGASK